MQLEQLQQSMSNNEYIAYCENAFKSTTMDEECN